MFQWSSGASELWMTIKVQVYGLEVLTWGGGGGGGEAGEEYVGTHLVPKGLNQVFWNFAMLAFLP